MRKKKERNRSDNFDTAKAQKSTKSQKSVKDFACFSGVNFSMNFKYKLIFIKRGDMKYISHLDLVRLFQRATRRAGLPIKMTQGFSPHPKISFGRALKVGLESNNEEAVLNMTKKIEVDDLIKKLNMQLPQGIRAVKASELG